MNAEELGLNIIPPQAHDLLTMADAESEILRHKNAQIIATFELDKLTRAAAVAERDHKRERAKAMLIAEGRSAEQRDAWVYQHEAWAEECDGGTCTDETPHLHPVTVGDLEFRRKMAEGVRDSQQELLRSIRSNLIGLTAVNANLREVT